jgi:hypothetical protein
MSFRNRLGEALSPPASVSKFDTGLRFTDILFGFVIRELFLRLQNWGELDPFVRFQLIAGTALVLGSWIGFRRSLNRSTWEVKFFNLPFARFVLDQLMVILYFRIAVLTPTDPAKPVVADSVVSDTAETLFLIFALYALWDLLGIGMAVANERAWPTDGQTGKWKYPKLDEEKKDRKQPVEQSTLDRKGLLITLAFLAPFAAFYWILDDRHFGQTGARNLFLAATVLLLAYRFIKEVKTSWLLKPASEPAEAPARA